MTTRTIVVIVADALADVVTDRMWQWGVHAVSEASIGHGESEIATSVGNDGTAIARALATLDPSWRWEVRDVDDAVAQVAPEHLSPTWYAPGRVSVPAALLPFDPGDNDPLVTVIVSDFVGPFTQQVRVVGEDAEPQAIPYRADMTALDVMIEVGGLTEFAAGNRSTLVRGTGGETTEYRVRLGDLVRDGDITANVPMQPGDVLIIPESFF